MAGADDETSRDQGEAGSGRGSGPPPMPAGVVDERFAVNIRERREQASMSQSELGRRMAALGWPWHPQTVQRVEGGQRKVSVGEAEALAGLLETSVARLMMPGQQASLAYVLETTTAKMSEAARQISEWTWELSARRLGLARAVEYAEQSPYRETDPIAKLLSAGRRALALTADAAVTEGRELYDEDTDESGALRHPWTDDDDQEAE